MQSNGEAGGLRPLVRYGRDAPEYGISEGCLIWPVLSDDGDADVSIARATVHPGDTTKWHVLDGIDERYLVVSGRGRADVEGLGSVEVGPGDVVVIPRGCAQRIENVGEGDLVFWCVCTPRFLEERYADCAAPDGFDG